MRVRLTTVIWGSDFVDTFLRLTLRSLLAPGNVPALAAACETGYTIYTTDDDRRRMEAAPLFAQLRQHVDLRVVTFTTSEIDASHFGSHGDLWVRGLDLARRNGEVLFFIIPDIIYGDGTLLRWAERLQQGFRAIYAPGPQVVLETIYDEFAQRFASLEEPIVLKDAEMRELLLRHMHPIPITMDRASRRRTGHAEYDLRAVPGRGLVIRVLSSHPFCVDPAYFSELRSFNPCDHLDKLAFEAVTVASAEPLFKHVSWYYRPNRLGSADLTQLGFWLNGFSPPACIKESGHVYEIPICEDALWREQRARAAASGAFMRTQLAAATLTARLFLGLAQQGFAKTARFLAAASFVAVVRRRIVLTGDETLLVPCDWAFDGNAGAGVWRLIAAGDVEGIVALLRAHIVGHDRNGRSFTLAGKPMAELARTIKLQDGPKTIAGFRVFAVDQILAPEKAVALPRTRPSPGGAATALPVPRTPPGLWDAARDDAPTHSFAPRSPDLRFEFEPCLTRPKPETLKALARRLKARARTLGARAAWKLLDRNRNLVRRAFLVSSTIPGVRRPAAIAEQTLAYAYRHGLRATLARLRAEFRGRIPTKLGPNRDASLVTDSAVPHYDRGSIQDIDPGAPLDALRAVTGPACQAPVHATALPGVVAASLRTVRLLRGLEAIEDVLAPYEAVALKDLFPSAPLKLVRTLRRKWCGDRDPAFVVEALLCEMQKDHPDQPEVLAELGYLLRDSARPEEALSAFAAASSISATNPAAAEARAKAATELGEMHGERGEFDQAVAAFERVVGSGAETGATYYHYGEALRRVGRIPAAVEAFARAMNASHPTWSFPKAGRDARLITLELHGPHHKKA